MRCECFQADAATLVTALTTNEMIERWRQSAAEELKRLADRRMAEHVRQLDSTAAALLVEGIDLVAARDPASVDAWLTDAVAVGTWNNWELPVVAMGERDLPVEGLPRGLIAADRSAEGAGLWVIDDETFALARWREIPADEAQCVRPTE
jgi:hypothetical protein